MRLQASQVAAATGGRLAGPDVAVDGASFDSRSLQAGQLFVPIVAERDGHEFIPAALDAGAAAYLTARGSVGATAIEVADTAAALMELATWARGRIDIPVVAVTGSVGKTSTKDFVAGALGATRRVSANVRSFNNDQGLPVTILGSADDSDALVVEMGMRGFGEIARLCEIAAPSIGVVTSVAASHTERVGGIDGVARAKRELIEALPDDGVAVLNADDARVAAMASASRADTVTYGFGGDVRVVDLELDELARPRFTAETPWGRHEVRLAASGRHMAFNAAAAVAVAGVIEGSVDAAVQALASTMVSGMRMEIARSATGALIVNDAYNANPDSMRAALDAVAAMEARRRIAILGPMAELDDAAAGHQRVLNDARERGIDVVAVQTDLYGIHPVDDPVSALGELGDGDVVLVKASRVAGLESVARALLDS